MNRTHAPIVVAMTMAVCTVSAHANNTVIVYDMFLAEGAARGNLARNTIVPAGAPFPLTVQAFGDRVTLAGSPAQRQLSRFDFLMTTRDGTDPGAALVDFQINFFSPGENNLPAGEPFFSSPVFTRELLVGRFENNPEDQVVSFDLTPFNLTVPDSFIPTVRVLERRDADGPGNGLSTSVQYYTISAAGANNVGQTPTNFIRQDFDGNWSVVQSSTTPRSAVFRILAVNPTPNLILGDFNFDGLLDSGDIDNFIAALLEADPFDQFIADFGADFTAQYGGTLTPALIVSLGDFDDNDIFDAGDIDGFVDAVLNAGRPGASVIPEPAALGLLAPAALLLSRRRR